MLFLVWPAFARSDEAKALGIKMGASYFQLRELKRDAGPITLSVNFAHMAT